ncbi:MAG: D-inositol-3-phosphate glycosyltransferase [Chlamydiales bacterium]|nr:D-inositol-3-phosphate glycosyltransferase [Chlamydiales bacterium]
MTQICVDARLYTASGIGTFLQTALKALALEKRFALTVLCRKQDMSQLAPLGAQLVPMNSWIYTVREQLEYVSKIPSCSVFWSPHYNVPLLPIKAKKRLATLCDVYPLAHFNTLSFPKKIYAKFMYTKACKLSDYVTTLSEFSRQEILKYIPVKPKKLVKITSAFTFQSPPLATRKEFFLCVGNLKPHKNLCALLKAYCQIKPTQDLYIVGKKEGLMTPDSKIFKEIERHPFLKQKVHFTGYISDQKLKELYATASVFIFPSLYEGYGYPPLEAMACACPVVASRIASIPEVCGDAVEYIDPCSIESIAQGIKNLLNNPQKQQQLIAKGKTLTEKLRLQKNQIIEVIDACCACA